jgi:hypothetical protein
MNTNLSIVFGSLLGACAIQMAMSACGSGASGGTGGTGGGHGMKMPGLGDAYADMPTSASASGCTAWETGVSYYQVDAPYLALDNTSAIPQRQALAVSAVPAGWEPLQVDVVSYGSATSQAGLIVYMRQCTAH